MTQAVEAAKRTLAEHWDMTLPVNPFAIATKAGVTVTFSPNMTERGYFSKHHGKPVIQVNPNDTPTRQRFTIFHELGHYKLGHGESHMHADQEFTGTPAEDANEEAANQFAAEMIMPEVAVRLFANRGYSIKRLASVFAVSERAMNIRLENLGILGGA
ncbi:MAG: ImmA/IrrE family metallo-endopeptidase [Desulfovibrio sp.]|nr:ImmA/IrrE family metallo-endopeptidase [Desulfovibrio sp.]